MKKLASLSNDQKKLIFIVLSLIVFGSLLFIGSVTVNFSEDAVTISASLTSGSEIPYENIKGVLLDTDLEPGSRVFAIGSLRLKAGDFKNDKYGDYKLYAYANADTFVVIQDQEGAITAFGLQDAETTMEAYETLLSHCGHLAS